MSELDALREIIGTPVIAAERFSMGFENRTSRVALANGDVRIVQQITNRDLAAHKIRLAQMLPERLAEVGVRAPQVLQASTAEPPYIMREFVVGAMGSTLLASEAGAIALATAMGATIPLLAQVRTEGLGLHTAWAVPQRLAAHAERQLARRAMLISAANAAALRETIGTLETLFADRPSVFAHGDYCPVNVIVEQARDWELAARSISQGPQPPAPSPQPLVLIDFEFARIADPLFDAAWWGWVVRYHHEERWRVAFPQLLAAAGIANDAANQARIAAIQRLRLLETLDYYAALAPERGVQWAERLNLTSGWNAD